MIRLITTTLMRPMGALIQARVRAPGMNWRICASSCWVISGLPASTCASWWLANHSGSTYRKYSIANRPEATASIAMGRTKLGFSCNWRKALAGSRKMSISRDMDGSCTGQSLPRGCAGRFGAGSIRARARPGRVGDECRPGGDETGKAATGPSGPPRSSSGPGEFPGQAAGLQEGLGVADGQDVTQGLGLVSCPLVVGAGDAVAHPVAEVGRTVPDAAVVQPAGVVAAVLARQELPPELRPREQAGQARHGFVDLRLHLGQALRLPAQRGVVGRRRVHGGSQLATITDAQPGEGAQALAAAVQVFGLPDGGATLRIRLGRRQVVGVPETGQVLADQARAGVGGHGLLAGEEQGKQQQAQAS